MNPSPRLQSFVGALLPPAAREHVLGDLCERVSYAPAARVNRIYLREAASLLPWILWSELRNAIGLRAVIGQTALVFTAFLCAVLTTTAGDVTGFLLRDAGLTRLVIPVLIVALVMIGQEIYAPQPWTQTEQMVPILLACGAAGFVQFVFAMIAPAWTLPRLMFEWSTINALIYLPIAQFFFPRGRRRRQRLIGSALEQDIDAFVRDIRRRTTVGVLFGSAAMVGCAGLAFVAHNSLERVGAILSSLAGGFVLWQCAAYGLQSAPTDESGHRLTRERFAEELQRQRQFHGGRVLWQRFFVALPGPLLLGWAQWLAHRDQRAALFSDALAFLTLWMMSVPLNWARAQRYGRDHAALNAPEPSTAAVTTHCL